MFSSDIHKGMNEIKVRGGVAVFVIIEMVFMVAGNPSNLNYRFEVNPVDRCPRNRTEFETASKRVNCTTGFRYLCTPNRDLTSLIEFCTDRPTSIYHAGNCVRLEGTGDLNLYDCLDFEIGCPDQIYTDEEIYKYPSCLEINTISKCFVSNKKCQPRVTSTEVTPALGTNQNEDTGNESSMVGVLVAMVFVILFLVVAAVAGMYIYRRRNALKVPTSFEDDEEKHHLIIFPHKEETCETKCMVPKCCDPPSLTLDFEDLESEHSLEDIELLSLLRRHCLQGAFEKFKYLLRTKILKRNDSLKKILESRDRDGRSLMHYAAKGGSVDILEELMVHCSDRKLDEEDRLGHTLLHIACKYGRDDICTFLLSREDYKRSQTYKTTKHLWNAAHFAAVGGNYKIFKFLLTKKFAMDSKTLNGLNMLDIACIYNHTSFCQELIKRSSELKLPLHESNAQGWNIAHIAAKVGNKDVLEILINGYLDVDVAKSKTHQKKTILHICCEYGHYELCKFIVENEHLNVMLGDIDQDRWNALHFCAKGGNLDAFKFIESMDIRDDEAVNSITALHISCIYKHVEIAKYLCNQLKLTGKNINELKTKTWWTPAHYVGIEIKQDGSEEELIRILVDAGIDLTAKTKERKTVLIVACEHRNKRLVRFLVKEHPELLKLETDLIKQAARYDAAIKEIINNAVEDPI